MKLVDEFSKQIWNIGFCGIGSKELISNKHLPKITWLKHPYRDRWFADPFIYKVTEDKIIVFVEEYQYAKKKGIISELTINRKTMELEDRILLLEKDTHLSYPAIFNENGKTYVYPENGESGKLYIYEYDAKSHSLRKPVCIMEEALADSTIIKTNNKYYLIATKYPNTQENSFLFCSDKLDGNYYIAHNGPIETSLSLSRPGGSWIDLDDTIFRPVQICEVNYGSGINMLTAKSLNDLSQESICFSIYPQSFRYNLGIHTINFCGGLCVVDGFGYLYPLLGRVSGFLRGIKYGLKNI